MPALFSQKNSCALYPENRFRIVCVISILFALIIIFNLFMLMILQRDAYSALAAGSHEIYAQLFPKRGEIYIQNSKTNEEYPIALNRDYFTVFADTREITDDDMAEDVAEKLADIFSYSDEEKLDVYYRLNVRTDPYEPLEHKVDEETLERLKNLDLPGIGYTRRPCRYYPEKWMAAQVIGFVGKNEEGQDIGRYGIEGYWQNELAGSGGFFEGFRSAAGKWIPLAEYSFNDPEDGVDLLLTIDRTIQYTACERLREAMSKYEAKAASLVIMDPNNGAIRAMCNLPDFDPNRYNEVGSIAQYNNSAIFTPYEPGSVFKPIVMSSALNEGLFTPNSTFEDTGINEDVCEKPIKNAEGEIYGEQTMTQILENSVNTGMIYVAKELGKKKMVDYLEKFGFGIKTGVQLDTEVGGTIDSLYRSKKDKLDCYSATASFGQGIMTTPLQLVTAYGAIANGGVVVTPRIVDEIRKPDGSVEKTEKEELWRVLDRRSASLIGSMLVSVIDKGHARRASVDGYYVAGKTGTAQIAEKGGYSDKVNHTFVGFAPLDDPEFVMLIKFEEPSLAYASYTTPPVFHDIAEFLLNYYQIPPSR